MLLPGELLNILKYGNHHYITSWCLLSMNNKKLMLLSQMTEHEWFEGALSELWHCVSLNVRDFVKLIWRKAISDSLFYTIPAQSSMK